MEDQRIERYRKMAVDDPSNEMGHFALGRALMDCGQYPEAIDSLKRVLEINPNISKAYQMLADCLLRKDDRGGAIAVLTEGVKLADQRGDMLPKNEMIARLTELGAAVPKLKSAPTPTVAIGEGEVLCKRCGKTGPRLAKPPFRNPFGQEIFASTCANCWREAIGMGTKVINELRLPMSDPQAQIMWDQHIREFLHL